MVTKQKLPLVVDLDGSLIRSDLLHEAIFSLMFQSPFKFFSLIFSNIVSLASFKTGIAREFSVDPASLPWCETVVEFIRVEHGSGRRIILATASPRAWADSVASHLGAVFSDVIASDSVSNLKGHTKLLAIQRLLGTASGFAYIGNSKDDIPILEAAEGGRHIVGNDRKPINHLKAAKLNFQQIQNTPPVSLCRAVFIACRPFHWAKNILILLPALTGIGIYDPVRIVPLAIAFLTFCFLASGIYVLNDLADLKADRLHPDKRRRPIASGSLSCVQAVALLSMLFLAGFLLAALTSTAVLAFAAVYIFLNLLYSSKIKEVPLADIFMLCGFYMLRVFLGIVVLELPPSKWYLSFLGCVFCELALWKRYVEAISSKMRHKNRRSYTKADAGVLLAFGVGFSFSASIVLSLYVASDEISPVYRSPELLILIVPILLIHNLGMWLQASRRVAGSDPVMNVLKSKKSWLALASSLIVLCASRINFFN
jgi:4-hydroxybenzoate polyprenyltransferase/beta-phosphoglucomutase-like phosphatase (HAD superfamily)